MHYCILKCSIECGLIPYHLKINTLFFSFNSSTLVKGNSGSIVYAVDAHHDTLYPLAMLVGENLRKPQCKSTVYQAVLLAPNLAGIEDRHSPVVSDLQSISTHCTNAQSVDRQCWNLASNIANRIVSSSKESRVRPTSLAMSTVAEVSEACAVTATTNQAATSHETDSHSRKTLCDSGIVVSPHASTSFNYEKTPSPASDWQPHSTWNMLRFPVAYQWINFQCGILRKGFHKFITQPN